MPAPCATTTRTPSGDYGAIGWDLTSCCCAHAAGEGLPLSAIMKLTTCGACNIRRYRRKHVSCETSCGCDRTG
jgi:hypothetical protein